MKVRVVIFELEWHVQSNSLTKQLHIDTLPDDMSAEWA